MFKTFAYSCTGLNAGETREDELSDRLRQVSDTEVQSPKQPPTAVVDADGDSGRPSSQEFGDHFNQSQSTDHSNVCPEPF